MSIRRATLGISILVSISFAIAYLGWEVYRASSNQSCIACLRDIHPVTRTIGLVEGRENVFCCPTCVIRYHTQTGKNATIVTFSDFNTGDSIRPADTFLVEGSTVNYCLGNHTHMDENKQAGSLDFDRCSPSILAFETRAKAIRFQRENGGEVLRFDQLAGAPRH